MTTQKRNHTLRYALALWGIVIILALIVTVLHEIGWIVATAVIAALAYRAGQQNLTARVHSRTRKIEMNARYGKPNTSHDSYAWGPEGYPPGPVVELDAVSPYPPSMTADEAGERVTGDPGAMRARLLRDKLSGTHKLFGDDNNV